MRKPYGAQGTAYFLCTNEDYGVCKRGDSAPIVAYKMSKEASKSFSRSWKRIVWTAFSVKGPTIPSGWVPAVTLALTYIFEPAMIMSTISSNLLTQQALRVAPTHSVVITHIWDIPAPHPFIREFMKAHNTSTTQALYGH